MSGSDFLADVPGEPTPTVEQIVAAIKEAVDEEAVFEFLVNTEPPRLDKLERQRLRDGMVRAAKGKLVSPASTIDAWLPPPAAAEDQLQGMRFEPESDPPWEDPVPGDQVLDEVRDTITAYTYMGEHERVACTLWTALTYLYDCFGVSPILEAASPTKRCGKSSLVVVISKLARHALLSSNCSASALFRAVEAWHPTLLIDEADTFANMADELRGILDAGHTKDTAFVLRSEGDANEPRLFSTWAPKMVAAIGRLPGTVEDRSVRIFLKRMPKGAKVEDAFDPDAVRAVCTPVRRRLARWAADVERDVRSSSPERVHGVEHRDWNNWKPLLAIAEAAGGRWPELARAAAKAMCGLDDEAEEDYAALIRGVRQVFGDLEAMSTVDLARAIAGLEDSPRADWWGGDIAAAIRDPFTADAIYKKLGQRVARDLRDFAKPVQLWIDGENVRGYRREDLQDAFDTYAPEDPSENARDASNARPQVEGGASDQGSSVPNVPSVSGEASGRVSPDADEAAAIELLVRELGATEVDPQAEFIREWNGDVYAQARARREAEAEKRKGKR